MYYGLETTDLNLELHLILLGPNLLETRIIGRKLGSTHFLSNCYERIGVAMSG